MGLPTLSNPQVEVNDEVISIVPNSFSYKLGHGDRKVKAQSAGGKSVEVVVTEDAETMISTVKFKLYNTAKNFSLADAWHDNFPAGNTIRVSEGVINESFRSMIVITDPERVIGADGEIEIEFNGQPVI